MRNLTKTLVAVSLLTSTSVHSLGIGGIKLRSALNQKLNAEIALVTAENENLGDIQVKLASPAKFDEAGVPWTYFLTKIKFTPIAKADGSASIQLTSDETLKEPYLNFLVEVTGPNGTLFREFTVLVDPPASYKQPVVKSDAPKLASLNRPVAPVPREEPAPERLTQSWPDDEASPSVSINEYGPTHASDTIWSIANEVKTDDVSANQMAMAIYEANPHAFSRPNVNALLTGKMLTIPDHGAVLKLSHQQALAEYKQQGRRWYGGEKVASDNNIAPAAHNRRHRNSAPKTHANNSIAKVAGSGSGSHLKLNPPPEENGSAQGNVVANDGLGPGLATDADLKQRFEKIERQLLEMQKILELKDAQLAALQKQQTTSAAAHTETEPVGLPVAQAVDAKPATEVKPTSEASANPPVKNAPEVKLASPPPIIETPGAMSSVNSSLLAPAAPIVPKPVTKMPTVTPSVISDSNPFADYYWLFGVIGASLLGALGLILRKRKVEKTIDTESMFASASQISLPDADKEASATTDMSSSYEVGTVGDSAFLSEFTPSEFDAFDTDQTEIDPLSEADVYLAYGRYQQAEELIRQVIAEHPHRNDCKLKLLEIFHTSENKLQFDDYVQQLMTEGKQTDTAFWGKVVEMQNEFVTEAAHVSDNTALKSIVNDASNGFKALEDEFDFDLGDLDDKPGNRSVKIEKNAAQTNSNKANALSTKKSDANYVDEFEPSLLGLNADSDLDLESSEMTNTFGEQENSSLEFDLNAFSADDSVEEKDAAFVIEDHQHNSNLEFDLNAFVTENATADIDDIEFIDENDPNNNTIEFDLNAFDFDAGDDAQAKNVGLQDLDGFSIDNSIEFTLDTPTEKTAQDIESFDFNVNEEQDEAIRELDFSTANLTSKLTSGSSIETEKLKVPLSIDEEFDFNFDIASGMDHKTDIASDSNLVEKENVFETKVNLANAYVDMGDIDAAKVIANDLLKGTAEQKKAGQTILEKIS